MWMNVIWCRCLIEHLELWVCPVKLISWASVSKIYRAVYFGDSSISIIYSFTDPLIRTDRGSQIRLKYLTILYQMLIFVMKCSMSLRKMFQIKRIPAISYQMLLVLTMHLFLVKTLVNIMHNFSTCPNLNTVLMDPYQMLFIPNNLVSVRKMF